MARIVVGIDGSDESKAALGWAVEEARIRHATVTVVHAWTLPTYIGLGVAPGAMIEPSLLRDAAEERAAKAIHDVVGDAKDVHVESKAVEATAARALIEEADGADLLVVGSRGHGGFAGLLLGSVSQQCAAHGPCPVVIVRTEA
jgi:nucleotide-binding universal stress UspA family protein